jgi:hypothetical protein
MEVVAGAIDEDKPSVLYQARGFFVEFANVGK